MKFIGKKMSHITLEELTNQRTHGQLQVEVGAIYHHYRDPKLKYKVIDIAIQEATEKICVVYKALYGDGIVWVRNLDSWLEPVLQDEKLVPRFKKVE